MGLVESIGLPFTHIHCKGLAVVWHLWIIWSAIMLDKIFKKRIWASGIVGGIRYRQDVLVQADRKPSIWWNSGSLSFSRSFSRKYARRFSSFSKVIPRHSTEPSTWVLPCGESRASCSLIARIP